MVVDSPIYGSYEGASHGFSDVYLWLHLMHNFVYRVMQQGALCVNL